METWQLSSWQNGHKRLHTQKRILSTPRITTINYIVRKWTTYSTDYCAYFNRNIYFILYTEHILTMKSFVQGVITSRGMKIFDPRRNMTRSKWSHFAVAEYARATSQKHTTPSTCVHAPTTYAPQVLPSGLDISPKPQHQCNEYSRMSTSLLH